MGEPFRLGVHEIHLPPNIRRGLNIESVASIAHHARTRTEPIEPQIEVFRRGSCWHLHDGRHRFLGQVIAGAADITVVEVPEPS